MSTSKTIDYTCPYCGRTFPAEIYESVTADTDEDLRDRCVSGDLFRVSCPKCQREFMIQYPLVYLDRRHKFVLWLLDREPGTHMMREFAQPLASAGYHLRRVTTLQEFTEKIQIFEDEVDDRLVELAKYDSLIEFIDNRKGTAEDVTSIDYQKTENGVMKINVRTGDRGMSFLIPVSMVEEELKQNEERYAVDESSFPVISSEWIISLFQEPESSFPS